MDLEAEFLEALNRAELFPDIEIFENPQDIEDWSDWK